VHRKTDTESIKKNFAVARTEENAYWDSSHSPFKKRFKEEFKTSPSRQHLTYQRIRFSKYDEARHCSEHQAHNEEEPFSDAK
jgi:hypothetical protein